MQCTIADHGGSCSTLIISVTLLDRTAALSDFIFDMTFCSMRVEIRNTSKHHTQESQEVSPFAKGDHKASRNRQDRIRKTNM